MGDKKKIIVVDDETSFLEIVKLNLEETGKYEVKTLSDAKDILTVVKRIRPDIILLDLVMPSLGGIEACEILNNDPETRLIPLIILSALTKDADKAKAFKLGVTDYLEKPIRTADLLNVIERCLKDKEKSFENPAF
jgi:CheY-like chemotaxis protein